MVKGDDLVGPLKPPAVIKDVYKNFQRMNRKELDSHSDVINLDTSSISNQRRVKQTRLGDLPDELQVISTDSLTTMVRQSCALPTADPVQQAAVFEVTSIPGLLIYPSLLPPDVQLDLLDKLLHRDLCNSEHKTNIHLHYHVPYPRQDCDGISSSYFDSSSKDLVFTPDDPAIHKPLTTYQVLSKKLRWITLGGQYDWTNKVYPSNEPPPFPPDIKNLIERLFPMKAEAAILNLYSPGDTLSLHQDVSEECDQPLVSISLGCDGIFVVGLEDADEDRQPRVEVIKLRSGDAVLMSGRSRYAWHGVPKVLEGTCPDWMEDWPCMEPGNPSDETSDRFAQWKRWMKGKRINLNVRQMFDHGNET